MSNFNKKLIKHSLVIDFLMPGITISSALFNKKGKKIYEAKEPITDEIIETFKRKHYEKVYYFKTEINKINPIEDKSDDSTKKVAVNLFANKKLISFSNSIYKEIGMAIKNREFIQTTNIHKLIDLLISLIKKYKMSLPSMMVKANHHKKGFVRHSLNVTIISIVIGLDHNFNDTLLKQIGIGAFLHDIGKLTMPSKFFDKEAQLTTNEKMQIRSHPTIGFELIKLNGQLSSIVRKIILLHHEQVDQKGYPLKLSEKDVGYYPFIVSLADCYDNLFTDEIQSSEKIKEILTTLMNYSGQRFPPYIVQIFIKHLSGKI